MAILSREENKARLEALMKQAPGNAASPEGTPGAPGAPSEVQPPAPVPSPAPAPAAAPAPAPVTPPAQPPAAPGVADPNANHDWTKRMEDAKAAQRALSEEQARIRREREELQGILQQIQEQSKAVQTQLEQLKSVTPPTLPGLNLPESQLPEGVKILKESYPDIFDGMLQAAQLAAAPAVAPLQQRLDNAEAALQAERQRSAESAARAALVEKRTLILQAHPDAIEIAESAPFAEWLQKLPTRTREYYSDALYHNTVAYDTGDVTRILDEFKRNTAPPAPVPPAVAPTVAPAIAAGAGAPTTLTPLTPDELRNYSLLYAEATPEKRAELASRLRATLQTIQPPMR